MQHSSQRFRLWFGSAKEEFEAGKFLRAEREILPASWTSNKPSAAVTN